MLQCKIGKKQHICDPIFRVVKTHIVACGVVGTIPNNQPIHVSISIVYTNPNTTHHPPIQPRYNVKVVKNNTFADRVQATPTC